MNKSLIKINKLSKSLGAEIYGIDLSQPINSEELEVIKKAFIEFKVLSIKEQTLSPRNQIEFSKQFGRLDIHVKDEFLHKRFPEILILSNKLDKKGNKIGFQDAGRYWHTDMSYNELPSLCSILYAIEVPPKGGNTLFCNMYEAYNNLPVSTKKIIQPLNAFHSYAASFEGKTQASKKRESLSVKQKESLIKNVLHPVVRTHPESKKSALYVNPGFTTHIDGMTENDSKELLLKLYNHSTKREFILEYIWNKNDLVIWDNRCLMHHASEYDKKHTRHMHRTTVIGEKPYNKNITF